MEAHGVTHGELYLEALKRFQGALERVRESGVLKEPTAGTLATADKVGWPSVRTVLLKEAGLDGFVFYTNSRSRKGRQIAQNPRAALGFYWDAAGEQALIEGRIEPVSAAESDAYWRTRPRQSQIAAWASNQSSSLKNREELLAKVESMTEKFEGKVVPRPPHWQGYRLVPDRIEFWTAKPHRLHDRLAYTYHAGRWTKTFLYP